MKMPPRRILILPFAPSIAVDPSRQVFFFTPPTPAASGVTPALPSTTASALSLSPSATSNEGPLLEIAAADAANDKAAALHYRVLKLPGGGKERRKGALDVWHTFTPPSMRGRGLAEKLTLAACQHCQEEGLGLVPTCSYVRDNFLSKHPEWLHLVVNPPD